MQELFDEIYMGKNHAPAAVPFKLQFVEGIATGSQLRKKKDEMRIEDEPFAHVFCEKVEVGIPFVTDYFSA